MSEPTITGSAVALGAVTITGSILGLHYDAMLIGFVAALVALMHLPPADGEPRTPGRVFVFVASAAFLAGVFAPALALLARTHLDWLASMPDAALRPMCAALIGGGGHMLVPMALAALRRRGGAA